MSNMDIIYIRAATRSNSRMLFTQYTHPHNELLASESLRISVKRLSSTIFHVIT
jgi:hypothetical protein